MKTILELVWVCRSDIKRFYRQKSWDFVYGYFSSLEKAEEAMKTVDVRQYNDIYCFKITEYQLDCGDREEYRSIRTYNLKGKLNGSSITADRELFRGRHPEQIRFKVGDIVESIEGRMIESVIVTQLPPSPERCKQITQRMMDVYSISEEELMKGIHLDGTDDSYNISSMGNGDTHSHPRSWELFPHSTPISPYLMAGLKKKLSRMP